MQTFQRLRALVAATTLATALAAGAASPARAFVLADPKADRDAIGNRNDVAAQQSTFVGCVRKAAERCQRAQHPANQVCRLTLSTVPPTTSFTGSDPRMKGIGARFEADVQNCIAAVDFARKGAKDATPLAKHAALGCPGDCSVADGEQPCADMGGYQHSEILRMGNEQNYLTGAMRGIPISFDPADPARCQPPMTSDPKESAKQQKAFERCIGNVVKIVTKYQAGLRKCQTACEADYAGRAGGGGPVDAPPSCRLSEISDPAEPFAACVAKVEAAATRKPLPAQVSELFQFVRMILDDAASDLFNEPDACVAPG